MMYSRTGSASQQQWLNYYGISIISYACLPTRLVLARTSAAHMWLMNEGADSKSGIQNQTVFSVALMEQADTWTTSYLYELRKS